MSVCSLIRCVTRISVYLYVDESDAYSYPIEAGLTNGVLLIDIIQYNLYNLI